MVQAQLTGELEWPDTLAVGSHLGDYAFGRVVQDDSGLRPGSGDHGVRAPDAACSSWYIHYWFSDDQI